MQRAMTVRAGALALLASTCLVAAGPAHAGTYNFQTLNNPGDLNFNQLLGINNSGTIAGYYGDGAIVPNQGYTLVPPSSYTNENFPGSAQTQVVGIANSPATTVGFYVDPAGSSFGFVDRSGTFTSVSDPNTPTGGTTTNQLLGVNDHSMAAGFYLDVAGNAHGYTYNFAPATPVFTPVNLPSGFDAVTVTATGIDNAGDIAGFFTNTTGNTFGFLDIGEVSRSCAIRTPWGRSPTRCFSASTIMTRSSAVTSTPTA